MIFSSNGCFLPSTVFSNNRKLKYEITFHRLLVCTFVTRWLTFVRHFYLHFILRDVEFFALTASFFIHDVSNEMFRYFRESSLASFIM